MSYVLGVDGGNTKTIALVAQLDGRIIGAGRSGCSDIYGAGSPEEAIAAVEQAVRSALHEAKLQPESLTSAAFSLAGADWPEDFDLLREAIQQRRLGQTALVVNDALGALRAGSPDGLGVVVACGTGAAVGARAANGRFWHSSFWQFHHGSRQLGFKTLRAICRAELGIEPPTRLTAHALEILEQPSVEALLHLITARAEKVSSQNITRLTRVLLDEAGQGDATAKQIVQEHGTALGDYALAAARQVGLEGTPFTLVLAGGVLRHSSQLLVDCLVERVRTQSPEVNPVYSHFEPVVGALFLALEAAGQAIDEALLAQLVPSLPAASLFETE
jgi:N-acetylglucosamine kinase-like BadF-type ATPase